MKRILLVIVIVAAGAILLTLGLRNARHVSSTLAAGDSGEGLRTIRFVKSPEPAPGFTVKSLDGTIVSPAALRGKVVVLNFWATWCAPCREEIPDLVALQSRYPDRLQILGLSVDEDSPESVKQFAEKMQINYPVAMASHELQDKFGGILGLPTSFILDTEGRVVQKHIGLRDPTLYDTEVRALLGLPVNAKVENFEDTGQIFLANASRATELPGVDFSGLTPEQKSQVLRELNEQHCTCGCGLTLAQCRINDTTCPVSLAEAKQIVQKIAHGSSARKKTAQQN